jgi:isoquinoline 1-oxidoreductase beta subunit
VAVRGQTFGQCIDAVRALKVDWGPGPVDDASDDTVLRELRRAELPLAVPAVPLLTQTVDGDFTFHFASPAGLEPLCAVADVRSDRAEIWAPLKVPIVAQKAIAEALGVPQSAVTVHVTQAGGSFGRKLFPDAAVEAALVSKAVGKPVKLMWHRVDECRAGRAHPMSTTRVRATCLAGQVLTFELRHTSVTTDFGQGLGEVLTAMAMKLPVGNYGFAQGAFLLTQKVPYNFGVVTQLLNEVDIRFNTGSMRQVYSPDVCCARELMVDQLAARMGKDAYRFRREFLKDDRSRAVLDKVARAGNWGRTMAPGTAQGIAFHAEFKGYSAALVEIDCRPRTTGRKIPNAVTGPRVTKVVFAVDVGLPVNPRGLEAQMMGGIMDGIALALTSSLHLKDGHFLEGSWDNYFYTRQWNVPPELEIHIMPATTDQPGGAGEFAVGPAKAAVACAYGRATGTMPTSFPINHGTLSFEPKPTVPPIPPSPTDGLDHAF